MLPLVVAAQFAGGSMWFTVNAVMPELRADWGLPPAALGHTTAAVQAGFIAGTLWFALGGIADRRPARVLFFLCALLGAAANLALLVLHGEVPLVALRFVTGIALAGIYPIGLKIVDGWFRHDLGHAMGFMVGALVLGKSLPFGLRALGASVPWPAVLVAVAALAVLGAVIVLFGITDGPYATPPGVRRPFRPVLFEEPLVRSGALGYFGHMWELYAFWAFLPVVLAARGGPLAAPRAVAALTGTVIFAGTLGSGTGAFLSRRFGSARVAAACLAVSGASCLASPLMLSAPWLLLAPFLVVWGFTVVADSGQFSALVAASAPRENVGSTLTLMNCVGFGITIVSIEMLTALAAHVPAAWLMVPLAVGPAFGILALRPSLRAARRR